MLQLADGARCWLSGYTTGASDESTATGLVREFRKGDAAIGRWARETLALGAAILELDGTTVGITDVVASVPLFLGEAAGCPALATWADALNAGPRDPVALRQLGLAGFTLGERCLNTGINSMRPGEVAVLEPGLQPRRSRYARYAAQPDQAIDHRDPAIQDAHNTLLLRLLERMMRNAGNRPIAIPLSAGYDSRAILSGLKVLGAENVITFSYGLPGNHEARGAEKVARHLGYRWTMIPYSHARQQRFFGSDTAARFFAFADRPDAIPFMQDVPALEIALRTGLLQQDAVMVNGQSGDFISGNHIPEALIEGQVSLEQAFADKHMGMWSGLKGPRLLAEVRCWLEQELIQDQHLSSPAAFELLEFESRQSKYVVAGQRAYEFFKLDWRLPLWEADYVDFWKSIPVAGKRGRRLFVDALHNANWAGVWGPDWAFPYAAAPGPAKLARMGAKLLCAPLGRTRWKAIDKRLFAWWTDPVSNYAIVPYYRTVTDSRGFRNALAWHVEAYLRRHGIALEAAAQI